MRSARGFGSIALMLLGPFGSICSAQAIEVPGPRVVGTIRPEVYKQVLDIVFPVDKSKTVGRSFFLTVRWRSSTMPEAEISVSESLSGEHLVEYAVADRNVQRVANEIFRTTGERDPNSLARPIHVRRVKIEIPAKQAVAWQTELLGGLSRFARSLLEQAQQFREHASVSVTLDGDDVDLLYSQGLSQVVLEFPVGDDREAPDSLASWAVKLRREVELLSRDR
jgi:hypothetical protein